MDLMQAGLALEKFIDIGSEARPADRDHARQAFRILCEAIRVANEENARVRDLAHRSDLPPDVVRGIERLREDLSAAVFAGREWKDKAQDKVAEVERLESELTECYLSLGQNEATIESLRAERAGFDELMTLRSNAERTLLAEVESLRAERGALGSTPYQAELVRLAALVDQHHSADLFGVDLAPSIWGRKCLVCDAALTSVEGGPVAQARGAATDSVIEPPSTSPPSERFCPTCGAECHCPWHGEMPCTDPFHTQPSDTEEVHVRIRDGRVTAMDGGPAPAAPSGATVVLHHDEEEEA